MSTYKPSQNLKASLAAWEKAAENERDRHRVLRATVATELKTAEGATNAVVAGHLPWSEETVRLIANEHDVKPKRWGAAHKAAYEPSQQLRDDLAAWEKAVEDERDRRRKLNAAIAREKRETPDLTYGLLAQHLPWTEESVRLIVKDAENAGRAPAGPPPQEAPRRPVYQPSQRLKDGLAAWEDAVQAERDRRRELRAIVADELRENPGATNADVAEHLPWTEETVRLIANEHGVTKPRKNN